jgi:hypothetical protein
VLVSSRLDDPDQKIMFVEGHWVHAAGGQGVAQHTGGVVYLAMSLRNVGSGIGVCQAWTVKAELGSSRTLPAHAPLEEFQMQTRDLYIPSGDIGMWQGALRNPSDPRRAAVAAAIDAGEAITVELLYSDQIGQQRTITRFGLTPIGDGRLVTVTRHWYLDWEGPRPERDVLAAVEAIQRDWEAAEGAAVDDPAGANGAEPSRDGVTHEAGAPAGEPPGEAR